MNFNPYTDQKCFRIFALVLPSEEIAYIGKTAGKRLSAVFSNHVCGKVAATSPYFGKTADQYPELFILETIHTSTAEAYRHVLCWIHRFRSNGYQVINHSGSLKQASRLLPTTQDILQNLPKDDLDVLLARTKLAHPTDADEKPASAQQEVAEKMERLNIRLSNHDKARFTQLSTKLHCGQRETFRFLLDIAAQKDREITQFARYIPKDIRGLEKENAHLKMKLSRLQNRTAPEFQRLSALQARQDFFQYGIRAYIQTYYPIPSCGTPLPTTSYKKFMRSLPPGKEYFYPDEDGFLLFFPEALLYGTRPALFVVGTAQGKRYKLRIYDKSSNIGFSLKSPYGTIGSHWYLGFRRANDGAMDLTFALPLPPEQTAGMYSQDNEPLPSLDDLIRAAAM
jgi:hypothetical protein